MPERDHKPPPIEYRDAREEGPSRRERSNTAVSGFFGGFVVAGACAHGCWRAYQGSKIGGAQRPVPWQVLLLVTLFWMGILVLFAWRRKRAAQEYRLGMLAGVGVVLLLSGLCYLA
jgi:hypothetical protein